MKLAMCGARGSTPAPGAEFVRYGGHTSCLALSRDGGRPDLLLDAGTGIRRVGKLLDGAPFSGSILLGHLHWDHIQGLPFFAEGDDDRARVDLYLPDDGADPVATLAGAMSPPYFPVTPDELRGRWSFRCLGEGEHRIEGYDVTAREIPHKGGRTFGYRISDGTHTVAYLSDHSPLTLGEGPDGHGPYHEAALALAEGADLLIHDAQYTDAERHLGLAFGHSTAGYASGLAAKAGVGGLLMFHHDPSRTDDQLDHLAEVWAAASSVPISVAGEQLVIDVSRPGRG